ncbi:hypothetical protein [Acidithiobacillus thiooxidans]|nr:hypothetical protein [Acidithiobacillus thiooxidans]
MVLGESINVPSFSLLIKNFGYIFIEDGKFIGSFVLIPYSKYHFPKPKFPDGYRPRSNYAHIGFITSSSKKNNIFDLVRAFSEALEKRPDLIFPLTITAKASTKHGLLFQYMCGFQRAYGKEDIENSGYGAITINKPFDSLAWAKKNFRKALSEYRRDIDKYQHAIHP